MSLRSFPNATILLVNTKCKDLRAKSKDEPALIKMTHLSAHAHKPGVLLIARHPAN